MNKVIQKVSKVVIRIRNNGTRKNVEQKTSKAIEENNECVRKIEMLLKEKGIYHEKDA